jgi:hypothetical protein
LWIFTFVTRIRTTCAACALIAIQERHGGGVWWRSWHAKSPHSRGFACVRRLISNSLISLIIIWDFEWANVGVSRWRGFWRVILLAEIISQRAAAVGDIVLLLLASMLDFPFCYVSTLARVD